MNKKWYKSRTTQYVIYITLYMIISRIVNFEFAVICALGTIIGEMNYNEQFYFLQRDADKTINDMKNRDLIRDAMMFAVKDITGRILREATVQSMIDDFEKQLSIKDVSQQRELLIAYNIDFYKGIHDVDLKHIEANVDKYLSKLQWLTCLVYEKYVQIEIIIN